MDRRKFLVGAAATALAPAAVGAAISEPSTSAIAMACDAGMFANFPSSLYPMNMPYEPVNLTFRGIPIRPTSDLFGYLDNGV